MKWLIVIIIQCIFCLCLGTKAVGQDTSLLKLEAEVASYQTELSAGNTTTDRQLTIFRHLAFIINQIGQIHFDRGNYEVATKYFVDADLQTRKYHEKELTIKKEQLIEAEQNLIEYSKIPEKLRHDIATKGARIVISSRLSDLIGEAAYFDDNESQKRYLERLAVVSREMDSKKGEADAYEKLGTIELNNDNPKAAFQYYNKALSLRKLINHEWWTIDYVAYAHWQLGENQKALEQFQNEISILRELEKKPLDMLMQVPEGGTYTEQELEERRERHRVTATIEKLTVRSSLAGALFNVAQLRMSQGKYGLATDAIREVNKIIDVLKSEQLQEKDVTVSSFLFLTIASHQASVSKLQGRILEVQGLYAEALRNYAEAAKVFAELAGGGPSGAVASIRGRMTMLLLKEQQFAEARANVQEVLRIRARLKHLEGTVYALILASRVERASNEMEAASKFARQAKASAMQLNFAKDLLAEATENEADNLLDQSKDKTSLSLQQAIVSYKSAIETYRSMELPLLLARSLNSLGIAYEKAEQFKEAEGSYNEAVEITETVSSGFSNENEAQAFQSKNETTDLYKRMVDLLVRQGKTEQALQFVTRAQRRGLSEAVPKNEIKLTGKSAEALKAVATAENKMLMVAANLEKARIESTTKKKNDLVTTLGAARQEYALAIKRLETEQPNLRFTVRPTDLLKLQASVAPGEAIVSYLVTSGQLYIFVVRKKTVAVRRVLIGEDSLRYLVAQARSGLEAFGEDFYSLSFESKGAFEEEKVRANIKTDDKSKHYKQKLAPLKTALATLYDQLISPVADLLTDVEALKIIPNGDLFLVPFAALISPENNQYLIENYSLVFLTAGDLITTPAKLNKGNLVAFGNPAEAELQGALEEVKAIQKFYPGSKIYTSAAATKKQLFKLTSAKILHFATHGHILSPLETSNIQLAHSPNNADPDLTYGEIYALPLESTEMVVLSACKTALGTVSGTEIGVFIEAFRTKTNTVAASLWSVDDLATRELMTEFYKNLAAGKSRADALRIAQLKLLKDGKTKNPLFWAAFVLYGAGGKLSTIQTTR